jgi:hypothetical protein
MDWVVPRGTSAQLCGVAQLLDIDYIQEALQFDFQENPWDL